MAHVTLLTESVLKNFNRKANNKGILCLINFETQENQEKNKKFRNIKRFKIL